MDTKLFEALQSYEVGFHLLPLPKSTGRADPSQQGYQGSGAPSGAKGNAWQQRSHPYKGKGHQGGGKGKNNARSSCKRALH